MTDDNPDILINKDDLLEQLKNSKVVNHVVVQPTLVSYTLYPFIALALLAAMLLGIVAVGLWFAIVFVFSVIWFIFVGPVVLLNKLYKRLTQKEDNSE